MRSFPPDPLAVSLAPPPSDGTVILVRTYIHTPTPPPLSNDEAMDVASPVAAAAAAAGSSPETTPEVWDRVRAFLRAMPSADSISRTPASLAPGGAGERGGMEVHVRVRVYGWRLLGWVLIPIHTDLSSRARL